MGKERNCRLMLVAAVTIFGSIGLFRRLLPLPSGAIAMARGLIGAIFLLAVMAVKREKPDFAAMKGQLGKLIFTGILIGLNWVALFEAYRFTSVAVATVCYYMAPIIVMALSPWLLKEKLTVQKAICVLTAMGGSVLVSGVFSPGDQGGNQFLGVALGLLAAAMYAAVVLVNKQVEGVKAYDRTVIQLGAAGLVLIPYVTAVETVEWSAFTAGTVLLLVFVGVVHTGIAYALYFGALEGVSGQTAALYSYIDPIVAVLISAIILQEKMDGWSAIGTLLVLGAALISEVPEKNR